MDTRTFNICCMILVVSPPVVAVDVLGTGTGGAGGKVFVSEVA